MVKFREVHVCGHPTKKFRYIHRTSTNSACDAIMQSAASIGSKGSLVGGATISRGRYNRSLTILVKYDFHTPRFPEPCAANFLSARLCDARFVTCMDYNHSIHIECHVSSHSGTTGRPQNVANMARKSRHANYHFASVGKYELNRQKSLHQQMALESVTELA